MIILNIIILLLTLIHVNSLKFESHYEAFGLDYPHSPCLGGCGFEYGRNTKTCYVSWHERTQPCSENTSSPTPKYLTGKLDTCISDCGKFDNSDSYWCAITESDWDWCGRNPATKGKYVTESKNIYAVCKDECTNRGYSYNWCHTVDGSWDECNPSEKTFVYDYPTEDSTTHCLGKCAPYGGVLKCYDSQRRFNRCFINPWVNYTLNEINNELKECIFSTLDEEDQSRRLCHIQGHRRPRRQTTEPPYNYFESPLQEGNDFFFEEQCPLTVDELIERQHGQSTPTLIRQNYDPNADPLQDHNPNPIVQVTMMQTHSYFREHTQQVSLLLNAHAIITADTIIANRGEAREHFGHTAKEHQKGLDVFIDYNEPETGKRNNDELGHVVAAMLGGPPEIYNLFPQPRDNNRGSNSRWRQLEDELARFVGNHRDRYVDMRAVLSYAIDVRGNVIHRPTAIVIRARYYIDGHLVHPESYSNITNSENPYENIYFTNDPLCEPLPRTAIVTPATKGNKRKKN